MILTLEQGREVSKAFYGWNSDLWRKPRRAGFATRRWIPVAPSHYLFRFNYFFAIKSSTARLIVRTPTLMLGPGSGA